MQCGTNDPFAAMSKANSRFGRLMAFATPLRLPFFGLGRLHGARSVTTVATAAPSRLAESTDFKPGALDTTRGFLSGPSVSFWRDLDPRVEGSLERLLADLRADVQRDSSALPYYTYCLGRSLYFGSQALVGLQLENARNRSGNPWRSSLQPTRHLIEAGYAFRDDWRRIADGVHRTPWDASLRHRQFNPMYMMRNAVRFLQSSRDTLARRSATATARAGAGLPPDTSVWLDSPEFPPYYRSTFHFQRDGWLSKASADVYEVSTETLFIGRQDAMQRLALEGMRELTGTGGSPVIVELGAGTGRLATFVLDTLPRSRYVLCDLSPFYLAKARENVDYWRRFRNASSPDVRYIQAPAERLPMDDASADVVLAVYLLHEMPSDARRHVAQEAARVLRPGGTFVLVDSIQLGDRPHRDEFLDVFENFNEPWYPSYVREDLGQLFAEFGLEAQRKELSSVTKMLTFRKTGNMAEESRN